VPSPKLSTYVALLRGINVGGKNLLPMAALVEMFGKVGCTQVKSYIQSGNVIFSATASCAAGLPEELADKIHTKFKFRPPVVLRSAEALAAVAKQNPFLAAGVEEDFLHVGLLADTPAAARVKLLDGNRSPGDRFDIRSSEIYLHLPNGMGKTKLTNAYFDSTLQTVCTFRNWRTVLKLVELSRMN